MLIGLMVLIENLLVDMSPLQPEELSHGAQRSNKLLPCPQPKQNILLPLTLPNMYSGTDHYILNSIFCSQLLLLYSLTTKWLLPFHIILNHMLEQSTSTSATISYVILLMSELSIWFTSIHTIIWPIYSQRVCPELLTRTLLIRSE